MHRIFLLLAFTTQAACVFSEPSEPAPPAHPSHPVPSGAQGVDGEVDRLVGDFQPCVAPCSTSGTTTPLAVPVHVFRGEHRVVTTLDPHDATLLRSVVADANGFYQVELDPGVYTVVAEIGGQLFSNELSGTTADAWATVTVSLGAWTEHPIDDTRNAAF
jgi:hypothetical protein